MSSPFEMAYLEGIYDREPVCWQDSEAKKDSEAFEELVLAARESLPPQFTESRLVPNRLRAALAYFGRK